MNAPSSGGKVDVTIRIDLTDAAVRFGEIVKQLQALGLSGAQSHPRFGIVNGSVPSAQMAALREVAGVTSVRQDSTYRAQSG